MANTVKEFDSLREFDAIVLIRDARAGGLLPGTPIHWIPIDDYVIELVVVVSERADAANLDGDARARLVDRRERVVVELERVHAARALAGARVPVAAAAD